MRRFELIEGTASQFWEIRVEDTELTVRFGRAGTGGQTRAKTFASNGAALAEAARLIQEKTRRGYAEVAAPGGPAATPAAAPPETRPLAARLSGLAQPKEAPAEALPEGLRNPPWTWPRQPVTPLPTLAITPLAPAAAMSWPEGVWEQWRNHTAHEYHTATFRYLQANEPELTLETVCLRQLHLKESAHQRVLAGGAPAADDIVTEYFCYLPPDLLLLLPDAAALAIWNHFPPTVWSDRETPLQALVARHDLACLPGLLGYAPVNPNTGLALARPFRCTPFAPLAAHALKNLKKARANAAAWLRAHPETAAIALIPPAFGKDRTARDNAQHALRWLAQNGGDAEIRRWAARYGEAAAEAVDRLLGTDPALIVPAKMPRLPAFFVPAAFRRPVLASGGTLPLGAVEHLGRMLTLSTLHEPYAGLEVVKAACTGESLAAFAWDGFEAWLAAGAPSREGWAFTALGLLGDDETARRLAPKIREWPGESAHARAVTGLDILAAIGTDVALMHLGGIANKVKFKALQDRAREKIAQVAEARGLTPEALADRLVPDLGLDEQGTAVLDFGPRRFWVGFDEALKPYVKDATGTRLKDLPKPDKTDDAGQAGAAVARFKALKKDAKALVSLQVIRLEQAMCQRRRWTGEEFRRFFLDHPLMRHLARRLVWGVYRAGRFTEAFRVAEDLSLADRNDAAYVLPDGAEIGLAHVLDMPEDIRCDFSQMFRDYDILPPFKQLGREIYVPTDEERRTGAIARFRDKKVATVSVMGLIHRGWERGAAQDAGWVGEFVKRLPGGLEAELQLDPGTIVGEPSYAPEQTLPRLIIRRQGTWGADGVADLAAVDPILVSEVIRDADWLAPLNPRRMA